MSKQIARELAVVVTVLLWSLDATAASFTRIPSATGSGDSSRATGVSADGSRVVGTTSVIGGAAAYIWDATNGTRALGDLPGDNGPLSNGRAISADGSTVVGVATPIGPYQAALWNGETEVLSLGGSFGEALAVSGDGTIVVGRNEFTGGEESFIWDAVNGMRNLGRLPGELISESQARGISSDGSIVVGKARSARAVHGEAYVWDAVRGMRPLNAFLGSTFLSAANAISADGTTIVGISASSSGGEAFTWNATRGILGLGDLPGGNFNSEALAVSANGSVIVGRASVDDPRIPPDPDGIISAKTEAFVWDAENGMRPLKVVLTSLGLDLSGWDLQEAVGVSADGRTIVGWGFSSVNPGRLVGFVAVIPEPGPSLLIGVGLMLLAIRRRAKPCDHR